MLGSAACAAAIAAAALSGCAAGGGGSAEAGESAAETATIAPVVRGAESGLEARLWAVEGRPGVLPAVLGEFGPPAGADPRLVDLWKQNGVRVLEVPLDRLEGVRGRLPTIGPLHREWLGLLPEWVEVVKGPSLAGERSIRLDSGLARLGPGRLRLVARCWPAPRLQADAGAGVGSLLRVELMPELRMPRQAHDERLGMLLEDAARDTGPGSRGVAFDRLLLGWGATGESAVLLVPEAPEADWSAPAPGRLESAASETMVFGPPAVEAPTLGELMLTNLTAPDVPGDARLVVVLVPRAPERFGVLPR